MRLMEKEIRRVRIDFKVNAFTRMGETVHEYVFFSSSTVHYVSTPDHETYQHPRIDIQYKPMNPRASILSQMTDYPKDYEKLIRLTRSLPTKGNDLLTGDAIPSRITIEYRDGGSESFEGVILENYGSKAEREILALVLKYLPSLGQETAQEQQ